VRSRWARCVKSSGHHTPPRFGAQELPMPAITNRPNTTTASSTTASTNVATTTTATPAADDAVAMDAASSAQPAATFDGTTAVKKSAPFAPPAPPQLRNEKDAMSGMDLERIRDHNESLIKDYNKAYGAYLDTYVQAVEAAPNLDRVRAFGPPVDYDPARSLPVSQRRNYDHLLSTHLDSNIDVHEAIGERVLRESGHKLPGGYTFFETKLGFMGQSVKERVEIDQHGDSKRKTTLGYSVSSPVDTPIGKPKLAINIDPETGKAKSELSTKIGNVGIAADSGGKISGEYGAKVGGSAFGEEASLSVAGFQSFDGGARRAEVGVKVAGKVGELEGEVKVGVGYQFLTNELVSDALDANDKGFFDDDDAKVRAMRNSGR
jgi:hypothetical protein